MPEDPFPRVRPGGRRTAADDNRLADEVARLSNLRGTGSLEDPGVTINDMGGQPRLADETPRGLWAVLGTQVDASAYAGTEQFPITGGLLTDGPLVFDADFPLFDLSGGGGLPAGQVVRAWPSPAGDGYLFATSAGAITAEYDDGTNVISPVFVLELHTPTFLLDEPQAGAARIRLNWGTDVQPVGVANSPGASERPARVDHVHAGQAGYTVVNVTDITAQPCSPGTVFYNTFDSKLCICYNNQWCCTSLTCVSGSGACVPGVCSTCPDPPYAWSFSTTSPTADWLLLPAGDCAWQQAQVIDGHTYWLVLTLGSVASLAVLVDGQRTATYEGASPSNCCASLVLTETFLADSCPGCDITPDAMALFLGNFTGQYNAFNLGNVSLPYVAGASCDWSLTVGTVTVTITHTATGRLRLSGTDSSNGATFVGMSSLLSGDCCQSPIFIDAGHYVNGTGPTPISVAPDCSAAPTLTLTPACCSGSGSGIGGGVTTSCCPAGVEVPKMLNMTLAGAFSGDYVLSYSGAFRTWDNDNITGCAGARTTAALTCAAGTWHLTLGLAGANVEIGWTCGPPIDLTFTVPTSCGNVTAHVTT